MKGLEYIFKTQPGSESSENGDSYIIRDNLFVVIEGIGEGYPVEIAREHACKIIPDAFHHHLSENKSPGDALIYALEEANKDIIREGKKLNEKVAVSVSAVFIRDRIMYFTHLGDARIYSFQDGELNPLTRDHTLKEEDPFAEKKFNDPGTLKALTRGLGINENPLIRIKKYPLDKRGLILMTTRGLTERLSDRDILWVLRNSRKPVKLSESLIVLARRKGSKGHMTLGVIRFGVLSKWMRNVLITYTGFFLLILVITGSYFLKYGKKKHINEGTETFYTSRAEEVLEKQDERIINNKDVSFIKEKIITEESHLFDSEVVPENETVRKTYNVNESGLFTEVYSFIGKWKTAWENTAGEYGDMERYIYFYSENFHSEIFDKEKWRRDKARKNRKKQWIKVEISDIKISRPDVNNQVKVQFNQDYKSSNFSVKSNKLLVLKKDKNNWRIISERSS